MLPFNFDYHKPKTVEEAVRHYQTGVQEGRNPFYMSGGTELLTLGRLSLVSTDIVIDLKGIPDYTSITSQQDYLVLGAGATLTAIEEADVYPLVSHIVSEIADRTARNKITLAGNICGQIFYREAVLPFLLVDCSAGVMGPEGIAIQPFNKIFHKEIQLNEGEWLFTIIVNKSDLDLPYFCRKRRQQWDTGYPLITLAAVKKEQEIRMAISGLCPFPFRSLAMEAVLNESEQSAEKRADKALSYVPSPVLSDVEGSADYRLFTLRNMMLDAIQQLEGEPNGA